MSERKNYIGTRVSEKEKEEIKELAKGINLTISDLIRHRVIRPIITLPEAIQNIKLYLDSKFKKFEHKITELIKEQSFNKPIQHISSESIIPTPKTPKIAKIQHKIAADPQKNAMRGILIEFQEKVQKILEKD